MATSNNSKFNVSAQQVRSFLAEVGIYTHARREFEGGGKEIWANTITTTEDLARMHRNGEGLAYRLYKEPIKGIPRRFVTMPGLQQMAMGLAHMIKRHWLAVGGVSVVDGRLTLVMNDEDKTHHAFENGHYGPFAFSKNYPDGAANEYEIIKNVSLVKIRGDQLVWAVSVVRRDTGVTWHRELSLYAEEVTEVDVLGRETILHVNKVFDRDTGLSTTFKHWNVGKLIGGSPKRAVALPKGWIDWLATEEGIRMMDLANRQANPNTETRNEARALIKARTEAIPPLDTERIGAYLFGSSLTCGIMACRGGIHLFDVSDSRAMLLFKLIQEAGMRVDNPGLTWVAAQEAVEEAIDNGNVSALPFVL